MRVDPVASGVGQRSCKLDTVPRRSRRGCKCPGMTPLHWASVDGYADLAWFLIEHGTDVAVRHKHGLTPVPPGVGQRSHRTRVVPPTASAQHECDCAIAQAYVLDPVADDTLHKRMSSACYFIASSFSYRVTCHLQATDPDGNTGIGGLEEDQRHVNLLTTPTTL
jgi:hypothetical protein